AKVAIRPLPITKKVKQEFFSPPENIGWHDVTRCFLFIFLPLITGGKCPLPSPAHLLGVN
ncbi:MAG: hypothetical protein ACYSU6_09955, partial [Planctomycetota bacterium]